MGGERLTEQGKPIRPSQLFTLSDPDLAEMQRQAKLTKDVYQYLPGNYDKERQADRLDLACYLLQSRRRAARQTGD